MRCEVTCSAALPFLLSYLAVRWADLTKYNGRKLFVFSSLCLLHYR
jgi:hypothetical protein